MRLVSLARFRFGLLWKSDIPELKWQNIANAFFVIALFFTALALSTAITEKEDMDDKRISAVNRQLHAEAQKQKAEQVLVACLNGRTILAGDGTAIFCEPYTSKL